MAGANLKFNNLIGIALALTLVISAASSCSRSSTCTSLEAARSSMITSATGQRLFDSPQQGLDAFVNAIQKEDRNELAAIFGPDSKDILNSGDPVADNSSLKLVAALSRDRAEAVELILPTRLKQNRVAILLGNDQWPMPVPLVQTNGKWSFDTAMGKEEIINRRIGTNELRVMELCVGYVQAQHEYQSVDYQRQGTRQFATKFFSAPSKKDGLYWEATKGEPASPMGPMVAKAALEGYATPTAATGAEPFQGYYFRILTAQGKNARGGAKSYIKNGKMTEGFALVAFPAEWSVSGATTFIVGPDGVIYQKNLGPDTSAVAAKITTFDPDQSWHPATF